MNPPEFFTFFLRFRRALFILPPTWGIRRHMLSCCSWKIPGDVLKDRELQVESYWQTQLGTVMVSSPKTYQPRPTDRLSLGRKFVSRYINIRARKAIEEARLGCKNGLLRYQQSVSVLSRCATQANPKGAKIPIANLPCLEPVGWLTALDPVRAIRSEFYSWLERYLVAVGRSLSCPSTRTSRQDTLGKTSSGKSCDAPDFSWSLGTETKFPVSN